MKHKFIMEGLDCAHCAGKIEEKLKNTEGFSNVSLVFPTKTLYLEHKDKNVVKTVQEITDSIEDGVTVALEKAEKSKSNILSENMLLFISIPLGILALILEILKQNDILIGLISALAVILSGYKVFIAGFKSIRKLRCDENFLMCCAVISAFAIGEFAEGAMVTILFGIGEMFESLAVNKSRKSIEKLTNIQPDTATVILNNEEVVLPAKDVEIGSELVIKPYERIPLDGTIIKGETSVDTSALTGEPLPKDCKAGDEVLSGMINGESLITIKTTNNYENSTAMRIIKLVEEASVTKSKQEKLITKFAKYYTPIVILISVLLAFIPPILSLGTFEQWIYRGIVCLVASCPCAIVISVPLSYYSGIGLASKEGILLKGGKYLEALAKTDAIVFDKTGTLTEGKPKVVNITAYENYTKEEVLAFAASCEKNSSHPIAVAIKSQYEGDIIPLDNYKEHSGYGVSAEYLGKELLCGSKKLIKSEVDNNDTILISYDGKLIGSLEVADTVRNETKDIINNLNKLGINNTYMLTGDSQKSAEAVAKEINIKNYYGELLPEDKVNTLKKIKENNKSVSFIGDGINDAPVLTASDCGFAMGFGSDIAIQAADAVLTAGNLKGLPKAIKIARKTVNTVKTVIAFSIAVKFLVLILAVLGIATIWMSVIADTGVTLLCVLYATRLLNKKA